MPFFTLGNVVFTNNELLGFHKLMDTNQTAGILAGSSGFAAETRRETGIKNREFVLAENFIGAQRIQNKLGSAGKVNIIRRHIINFIAGKRQISLAV